jgi:hypothetical protein
MNFTTRGWDMDNREKSKPHKINILAQADAHIGIPVEHASWLRLSIHILDPIVKNCEEIHPV